MLRMLKDIQPGNPTIKLRFCLDPGDREKLLTLQQYGSVFVLLVVAYQNDEEDRQLIPLEEIFTYVGFRFPGVHQVLARLVCGDPKTVGSLLKAYSLGDYRYHVLEGDKGNQHFSDHLECVNRNSYTIDADEFSVDMPAEWFAKEPPQWLQKWANLWHKYDPIDQCEFRRRVVTAFAYKWIGAIFYLISRTALVLVVLFVSIFLGARRLQPRQLFHPWKGDIDEVWPEYRSQWKWGRHSWIFHYKDGRNGIRFWPIFVSPPVFATLVTVLSLISRHYKMGIVQLVTSILSWSLHHWTWLIIGIPAAYAGVYFTIKGINHYFARKDKPSYQARLEAQRLKREKEMLKLLSCPTATSSDVALNLNTVPFRKLPLKLYYLDTKRRWCKTFAG